MRTWYAAKKTFVSHDKHFDKVSYDDARRAWFDTPGVKRSGETFSEHAYLRAVKRVKRNPDDDNEKRKRRANYNISVQEKRDREYSEWA